MGTFLPARIERGLVPVSPFWIGYFLWVERPAGSGTAQIGVGHVAALGRRRFAHPFGQTPLCVGVERRERFKKGGDATGKVRIGERSILDMALIERVLQLASY